MFPYYVRNYKRCSTTTRWRENVDFRKESCKEEGAKQKKKEEIEKEALKRLKNKNKTVVESRYLFEYPLVDASSMKQVMLFGHMTTLQYFMDKRQLMN